jgi:hypothetical protein
VGGKAAHRIGNGHGGVKEAAQQGKRIGHVGRPFRKIMARREDARYR